MGIKSIAVLGAGHGGCAAAADLGAVGVDYMREGLTLERLGLAGKSPSELLAFVENGA
jgi:hypothetical protein